MLIAMWKGTDSLSTSSKFGQKSRLILKVNYKANGYIGDLDLKCKLYPILNSSNTSKERNEIEREESAERIDTNNAVQNITQVLLSTDDLLGTISKNKKTIESAEYEYDPELRCKYESNKTLTFDQVIDLWSKDSGIRVTRLKLHA
jgi:hypothetical protein